FRGNDHLVNREPVAGPPRRSVASSAAERDVKSCWVSQRSLQRGKANDGSPPLAVSPPPGIRTASNSGLPAVALFLPGIAAHMVAVRFPEAGAVVFHKRDSCDPLGAFPGVQAWNHQPRRAAVFHGKRLVIVENSDQRIFGKEVFRRQV